MSAPLSAETRPFRVAVYALFLCFVAAFIGLVTRSIWRDVYGRSGPASLGSGATPAQCIGELEGLFHQLESRSAMRMAAREEPAWDSFSREFEERLNQVDADCSEEGRAGWTPETQEAVSEISEALQALRTHYARCGEEGETTRTSLVKAFSDAKAALKR